jgi:hypothetical protein
MGIVMELTTIKNVKTKSSNLIFGNMETNKMIIELHLAYTFCEYLNNVCTNNYLFWKIHAFCAYLN